MEIWKQVKGFENLYEVSNLGRLKSLPRKAGSGSGYMTKERILKPRPNNKGYCRVNLCKNGEIFEYTVHRLVALNFIKNPSNLKEVNHIDENKENNSVENLEWMDRISNVRHGSGTEKMGRAHRMPVDQYDLKGNLIKSHTHLEAAAEEVNGYASNISNCAKGKIKTSMGFVWKFPANTEVIK